MTAVGETRLEILLGAMAPMLTDGLFVYAAVPPGRRDLEVLRPIMIFEEREGATLILTAEAAEAAGIDAIYRCRMITLEIHSSLEAIGLLAAVTARLAAAGMSVNAVSAFYHDHLFVPADRAEEAIALLKQMAVEARR